MHLKNLELIGFKSFAKKTRFAFTSPITAIVGPNGSGKSNVAEAFRFALGEQSQKRMRSKRTEDLIWNGSASSPRAHRAHVTLSFDNRNKLFPAIDFEEVAVERAIHRDTISEYRLNGSPVRLKDIIEMLSAAHIGVSGHHIISQGEADRILSVNSRERKEMIEDGLGLKIYQYKKEESARKLQKTGENIKEAEGLRREIRPHLAFLEKQVEKVERAREMRSELLEQYLNYFAREEAYLNHTHETLEKEQRPLAEHARALDAERAALERSLAAAERLDDKTAHLAETERRLRAARDRRAETGRELGRLEGAIVAEERAAARKKGSASATIPAREALVFAEKVHTALTDAREAEPARLRGILPDLAALARQFIEQVRQALAGEADDATVKEIAGLRQRLATTQDELHTAEREEAVLVKEYEQIKSTIEKETREGRETERMLFRLTTERNELSVALTHLAGKEAALRLEAEEFEREKREAHALAGDAVLSYRDTCVPDSALREDRGKQEERKHAIERLKIGLEDSGSGNEDILKEFNDVKERDTFLEREISDLKATAASLEGLIADLEMKLSEEFALGLQKINDEFQTFFSLMFGGGDAKLKFIREKRARRHDTDLVATLADEIPDTDDGDDEIWEGVDIKVDLPRKKVRSLEMLSGGERALTSIALIFAMSQVNPPPFLVLDETDAALDEANSRRYGDMIENLSKKSQLILITHNRETMSRAGVLYGITMGADGVSQVLSVSFEEAVQVAK